MNQTSTVALLPPIAKTHAYVIRAIDYHIMACGPTNATRVNGLFEILEHCGELLEILNAMPEKGEGKLRKALYADDTGRILPLEAKWLKRFDAFRMAEREKSSATIDLNPRAHKMAAAIGIEE